jgi:hypothetical protein
MTDKWGELGKLRVDLSLLSNDLALPGNPFN